MNRTSERLYNGAAIVTIFVAAGTYAWLLWQHSLNIPYRDDIHDILRFLIQIDQSQGKDDILAAFSVQQNDHRTAASRLLYLLFFQIRDELDFRVLGLLINLCSIGFALFFASSLSRDVPARALYITPIALLLFQPQAYALFTYPMAMASMYGVFVYAILSFCLIQRSGLATLVLAILCATLATFSQASGQLVWLLGLVAIYLCRWQHRGYTLQLLMWLTSAAAVLTVFHTGYLSPNSPHQLLLLLLETPARHGGFFLGLLGSSLSLGDLQYARIAGATLLALLLWLSSRRTHRTPAALFFSAWFCVFVCMAITLGRATYTFEETAIGSRFTVPSQLLLCCIWVQFINEVKIPRLPAALVATGATLALCISSYNLYLPQLEKLRQSRVNQLRTGSWIVFGSSPASTRGIVEEAIKRDIYRPPVALARTGSKEIR